MAQLKTTFTLCLLLCGTALAADVTGKWSGTVMMKNPEGQTEAHPVWMSLKQTGDSLTGTAGPTADRQSEIKDGKVDGDKLEFKVNVEDASVNIQLRAEGERLKGEAIISTPEGKLTAGLDLKRVP